jgi:peptide/nickel transport system permease protein
VLSQLGVDVGTLLGGIIVTESVFGLPGLGQLALQSVTTQDLPVIIGTVVVASFFIVIANLLVDIGYALLDPRVRPS